MIFDFEPVMDINAPDYLYNEDSNGGRRLKSGENPFTLKSGLTQAAEELALQ